MLDDKGLQQLTNCALCANMCKYSCPIYLASGEEAFTPQKIARLILYDEKGFLEDRKGFFDIAFASAMCGACSEHCIYDNYDLRDYIQMARVKAFREDCLTEEVRRRVENFKRHGNPHGERESIDEGIGEVGCFVSCSGYKDDAVLAAIRRVFAASGRQVHLFGGADICCGAPLYYAGETDGFQNAAKKMAGAIAQRGIARLVVDCPNCMRVIKHLYAGVGVDPGAEVVHTSEFILDLVREGEIELRQEQASATYHDPCILANDMGVTRPARELLNVLGFEVREPVYTGDHTHCCGGTPGARIGHVWLADKVRLMRVHELRQTQADNYVSACPTCKAVLADLNMKDICELVAEHMANE